MQRDQGDRQREHPDANCGCREIGVRLENHRESGDDNEKRADVDGTEEVRDPHAPVMQDDIGVEQRMR